ncbi:MAG TPA: hypothetical protein VN040_23535 [Pseudosphingobacterium sp.]|nr:hypothetical protein [Pseudosphingobacterium sp.]
MDYLTFTLIAVAVLVMGILVIGQLRAYSRKNASGSDQSSGSLQDIAGSKLDSKAILRVQDHFYSNFMNFDRPVWQVTDHGIAVKCKINGTAHLVYYKWDGEWKSTLRRYTGEVLPQVISDSVRAEFMHYTISCTEEVRFSDSEETTNILYIQKGNKHLEVIIENNEITIMNEKDL